jgi:hypothetical protein
VAARQHRRQARSRDVKALRHGTFSRSD